MAKRKTERLIKRDGAEKIILYKNDADKHGLLVRFNHGRYTWHCATTGKYVDHEQFEYWEPA